MTNTPDDITPPSPITEQQKALDALINNLGRVIGTDSQSAWVTKVTQLKTAVSAINVAAGEKGENTNHRLVYDADKVAAAISLVNGDTRAVIGSALHGMQPQRKQKSFSEQPQTGFTSPSM